MIQEEKEGLEMEKSILNRRTFILTSIGSLAGGLVAVQGQQFEQPVPFDTIRKEKGSAVSEKRNYVINTNKEWKKLWNAMNAFQQEPLPLPEVDFEKKMLIAVFQGYQASIANITITDILKTGNNLTVKVKEVILGKYISPPCPPITANVITPFHIVQIDRISKAFRKRIVFETQEEPFECP
jgi:hypothetical protein